MATTISVIILTYNEEMHIARCINNVKQVADEVFVIDSFSTDDTCSIAEERGATVVKHAYVNQAQQFQWALDNMPCKGDWVMRIDADEYLTDELIEEIKNRLPRCPEEIKGFLFPLDVIFLGKNVQRGRIRPPQILRLWRNGAVYMEQRWMDERCVLKEGTVATMKGRFVDHNLNSLTWWTAKHNNYSNREVAVEMARRCGLEADSSELSSRNEKKSRYYSLPPFFRAFAYFFMRYILLGGFLDGKAGLIWAMLQAYWYRFLIDAKMYEMERAIGTHPTKESIIGYIKKEYNIDLTK